MKLLVHSATGPENPTRVALASLVARSAAEEGHDVRLFLAGEAVHLAREATSTALQGWAPAMPPSAWLRCAGPA